MVTMTVVHEYMHQRAGYEQSIRQKWPNMLPVLNKEKYCSDTKKKTQSDSSPWCHLPVRMCVRIGFIRLLNVHESKLSMRPLLATRDYSLVGGGR
jgi:hypothetical protein